MKMVQKLYAATGVMLLAALAATGCVPDPGTPHNDSPADNTSRQSEYVQDLWVVDTAAALNSDYEWIELVPEISARLIQNEPVNTTILTQNITFLEYQELQPSLQKMGGTVRDDFDMVAGLLDAAGELSLAVLASPKSSTKDPITVDDLFRIDVTFMDGLVSPGDPIVFDFALLQGIPGFSDAEKNLTGIDLFQYRAQNGQVQYQGLTEAGKTYGLKYMNQVGMVLQGSEILGLPGKEAAMEEGFRDGIESCLQEIRNPLFGLNCAKEFYQEFGLGAVESWEQINDNLDVFKEPEEEEPQPEPTPEPDRTPPPKPKPERKDCGAGETPYVLSDGSSSCIPPCTDCDGGGKVFGDPHFITFDGNMFQMHGIGEFLLADNGTITAHGRTAQGATSQQISSLEEVAFAYDDTVFVVNREAIFVNGERVTEQESQYGEHQIFQGMRRVIITNSRDYFVEFEAGVFTLEFSLSVPKANNPFTGLLGNNNGKIDDFFTRDLTPLGAELSFDDLYQRYANSWRITDEESLLRYGPGETTATYTDLTFPQQEVTSASFPEAERNIAERLCLVRGISSAPYAEACMLDLLVLNNLDDLSYSGDLTIVDDMFRAEQISTVWHETKHQPWGHPRFQKRQAKDPREQEFTTGNNNEIVAKSWGLTGETLKNLNIAEVEVVCAADGEIYPVFGGESNVYSLDSSVCSAAVHRGFVNQKTGGSIVFMVVEGIYDSPSDIVANGVTARAKRQYEGFQLVRYGAY